MQAALAVATSAALLAARTGDASPSKPNLAKNFQIFAAIFNAPDSVERGEGCAIIIFPRHMGGCAHMGGCHMGGCHGCGGWDASAALAAAEDVAMAAAATPVGYGRRLVGFTAARLTHRQRRKDSDQR